MQEAAPLAASASIINLSDQVADTVVFTLSLTDFQNRTSVVATDTLLGLGSEETATVTLDIDTNGLAGRNVLTLEARQPGLTEALPGPEALEDRIVVLAFFASWCPPCHPEFDHLKAIDARYRDDEVTVVAVNIFEDYIGGGDTARLEAFLVAKAPAFAVLGEGERVAGLFGKVERIPTLFVFGTDGGPVLHFIHARGAKKTHAGYDEIEAAVRGLL